MKDTPTVCAVMLANGREAMVRRGIRAFENQSYKERSILLIFDTTPGRQLPLDDLYTGGSHEPNSYIGHVWGEKPGVSIGELRNMAAEMVDADVICHWDSDDWSHPRRIENQVSILKGGAAGITGYRSLLFWDTREPVFDGQAFMYLNADKRYIVGTSLCYWRDIWKARPFKPYPRFNSTEGCIGEDDEWHKAQERVSVSGIWFDGKEGMPSPKGGLYPMLIASVHGKNTMHYERNLSQNSTNWLRTEKWDQYCRQVMAL